MIIVVSDIFGKTPALEKLCCDLSEAVEIIDPYNGNYFQFKDESEAYSYFTEYVGLKSYSKILNDKILNLKTNSILIGFSVGASAIWQISNRKMKNVSSTICFYGSQIRNNTNISPAIPMRIVMPKSEEHFSVKELSNVLKQKQHVTVCDTEYFHGFMNLNSKNYNEIAYKYYIKWLHAQIT